ncbi:MAG: hypothetical protein U9Q07_00315 [Planctomycetota bacterium]|nr:hypothetical protein [Planctomycetota bacterium]
MTRVVVDNKPMRGYAKWLLAEHNESRGRQMVSWYVYEAPDNVAAEMISKGARIEHVTQIRG